MNFRLIQSPLTTVRVLKINTKVLLLPVLRTNCIRENVHKSLIFIFLPKMEIIQILSSEETIQKIKWRIYFFLPFHCLIIGKKGKQWIVAIFNSFSCAQSSRKASRRRTQMSEPLTVNFPDRRGDWRATRGITSAFNLSSVYTTLWLLLKLIFFLNDHVYLIQSVLCQPLFQFWVLCIIRYDSSPASPRNWLFLRQILQNFLFSFIHNL